MTTTLTADDGSISGSAGFKTSADSSGTLGLVATSGIVTAAANTGGFIPPSGTTAQRPSSPVAGTTRYNTSLNQYEVYSGVTWIGLTSQTYAASYLIVAGGAGGGGQRGEGSY